MLPSVPEKEGTHAPGVGVGGREGHPFVRMYRCWSLRNLCVVYVTCTYSHARSQLPSAIQVSLSSSVHVTFSELRWIQNVDFPVHAVSS